MIQEAIKRYLMLAPLMIPDIIGDNKPDEIIKRDGYAILTYSLDNQYSFENIVNLLENEMELTVLYNAKSCEVNSLNKHSCLFSQPDGGNMFKVNIVTNQNGFVDTITTTIYTSIEQMASELQDDRRLHLEKYCCWRLMDYGKLLACFS